MTETDGDRERPGKRWLWWSIVVGAGVPITFGAYLGNVVEGMGIVTPGLEWEFWAQTFAFLYGGLAVALYLGGAYLLVGRGQLRVGGWGAVLGGLLLTAVGLGYPLTAWWLAGPLAIVGGGKAVLAARDTQEAGGAGDAAAG